jgi:hypothetical protein
LRGANPRLFYFPGAATLQTNPKILEKVFMMIFTLWTWKTCGCFKEKWRGGEMEEEAEEFKDDVWDPEVEEEEDLGF